MKEKQFSIDFAFILLLFCLFTMSSLAIISIGSKAYSSTVDTMEKQYTQLTAIDYIKEKVRQNNTAGMIEVKKYDDLPVLCIHEQNGMQTYTTYIYHQDHKLKELYVQDDQSFDSLSGQSIMELDDLSFSINDHLLTISLQADGQKETSYIALTGGIEDEAS